MRDPHKAVDGHGTEKVKIERVQKARERVISAADGSLELLQAQHCV